MGGKASKEDTVNLDNEHQNHSLATCLQNSKLCLESKQYNNAIYWSKKGIKIAETMGDKQYYMELGFLLMKAHCFLEQFDDAIDYGKKCIAIANKTCGKKSEMKAYLLLGQTYDSLKQYDDAIECIKNFFYIAKEIGDKPSEMHGCLLLGFLYFSKHMFKEVFFYSTKCIDIAKETGNKKIEMKAYLLLGDAYSSLNQHNNTISCIKKCIDVAKEAGDKESQMKAFLLMGSSFFSLNKNDDAIDSGKKCIAITKETGSKEWEMEAYLLMGRSYFSLNKYDDAIDYGEKCIGITVETVNKKVEMDAYFLLAEIYYSRKQYSHAIIWYDKYFNIAKETLKKEDEKKASLILSEMHLLLNQCNDTVSFSKHSINIAKETGDKQVEMAALLLLGNAHFLLAQFEDALFYSKKSIELAEEIGDKKVQRTAHWFVGKVYFSMNQYSDVIVHCNKCFSIAKKNGDQQDEKDARFLLGETYYSLDQHHFAILHSKEGIKIAMETNNTQGLSSVYLLMGQAHYFLKQYHDVVTCCKKFIDMENETGDKLEDVMDACLLLGEVYYLQNQHHEASFYTNKCIELARKTCDKPLEMDASLLLGKAYYFQKQFEKAIFWSEKCSDMAKDTGNINFETQTYLFQAKIFLSTKNIECFVAAIAKSLALTEKLSNDSFKQSAFMLMFTFLENRLHDMDSTEIDEPQTHQILVDNPPDNEIHETAKSIKSLIALHEIYVNLTCKNEYGEAIAILEEIMELELGSMETFLKSFFHEKIGCLHQRLYQIGDAANHFELGLSHARQLDCKFIKTLILFKCSRHLGLIHFRDGHIEESIACLRESISCIDFCNNTVRESCKETEDIIIDFYDNTSDCYNYLARSFIMKRQFEEALLVLEQRNARALKERLISKHEMERQESDEEHLIYSDIVSLVSTNKFSILFYSVLRDCSYIFLVENCKDLQFRPFPSPETHIELSLRTILSCQAVKTKDRTLDNMDLDNDFTCIRNNQCDIENDLIKTIARVLEYFSSSSNSRGRKPSENTDECSLKGDLEKLYYKLLNTMTIEQEEIVIIPDGPLYKVPFAALQDPDTGQYLSETKRIRLSPSITALKFLQDLPSDYHLNKGAVIIGDPLVGKVMMNGKEKYIQPLKGALKEAKEIASILMVHPLLENEATKTAVLKKLQQGASIVHIAAHGSLSKCAIPLAPSPEIRATKIPDEKDYMLTMADVQKARVRAQLVVLSCCDSGRGEIRAEGVASMCRAFLASGARAVVASLWAIDDEATWEFMKKFYLNLREGKSAGTSLQLTMNDLRNDNKYNEPKYWAPFFLMGDDVTIKF